MGKKTDWYKMASMDVTGKQIEARYMNKNLDLNEENWNRARRAGFFYKVKDAKVGEPPHYYDSALPYDKEQDKIDPLSRYVNDDDI